MGIVARRECNRVCSPASAVVRVLLLYSGMSTESADLVECYLNQIGTRKLLSKEREIEICSATQVARKALAESLSRRQIEGQRVEWASWEDG